MVGTRLLTVYTLQKRFGKVLDVLLWEGLERVLLEEIVYAHPIQLRDQTWVISKVKVFVQVDTFAVIVPSAQYRLKLPDSWRLTLHWAGRSS